MATQSLQSPCRRVFHIPELLETILAQLSMRDLLLSQRTARCVRDTVQSSILLRRKLFLEPDWKHEDRLFNAGDGLAGKLSRPGRKPENNRMLLRAFPGCYPTITLVFMNDGADRQARFTGSNHGTESSKKATVQWSWDLCISFPADGKPAVPVPVDYAEASWRDMYLSQPPCQELYLVRRWQRGLKPAIIRDGGIKMGDLIAEATKPVPACEGTNWHTSYISSDRDWHFEGNIRGGAVEA
ncbi:Putative F-box-like domain superfamily protein [Septoria linicola]|uniref:F-box-like domain superfamily protein n=1 Tax=Septoria linicola TaxID=215465 RepID=A0A9Q9EI45_9PEZI|nr:putative F-box-like domain superfamily protein [Septoria linicola]USW52441.1 Putative F-box-like domain superfamily protein [Septoria linicola]